MNGRLREFNFRKSSASGVPLYQVNVPDDRGERVYLNLHKEDKDWVVNEKISLGWLQEAAKSFNSIIQEFE